MRMLNVWIGNLGKYNEGYLVGDWLELPVSQNKLNEFLRNNVKLDLTQEQVEESIKNNGVCYEEYMINDSETDLPIEIGEYESLNMLNLIAAASNRVEDMNALISAIDSLGGLNDKKELLNLMLQADDIPFFYFDNQNSWIDKEEKYGMQKVDDMGLDRILEQYGIASYFDYKAYARDDETSGSVEIFDDGYIDLYLLSEIDLNKYSYEELRDILNEDIKNLETLSSKEVELSENKLKGEKLKQKKNNICR